MLRFDPIWFFSGQRKLAFFIWALLAVVVCRADLAVLREKGPWSGTAFANPGVIAGLSPETKITMRSADVHIRLSRGPGDTLRAKCEADFELENVSTAKGEPEDFLVGFPVTGLNSKIVTVSDFTVSVDGRQPATVLRQGIVVGPWSSKVRDTAMAGQLEAKFQPAEGSSEWGVSFANKTRYRDTYVWVQPTRPGAKTRVKVTYSAELRPQMIKYSKSYKNENTDGDVIPFEDLNISKWDEPYYFFDYILRSGATWDGPIGRETITLSADPELGLPLSRATMSTRRPVGALPRSESPTPWLPGYVEADETKEGSVYEFKGKPESDLLIAIPKSAIGAAVKKDP